MKITTKKLPNGNTEVRYWDVVNKKYVRSQHPTKAAAVERLKEIDGTSKQFGESALMTPAQRMDYLQAIAALPKGVSLLEAVVGFKEIHAGELKMVSIGHAVTSYLAQLQPVVAPAHYTAVERYLKQWTASLDATLVVSSVSPQQIQDWLDDIEYGQWAKNGIRRKLSAFFTWAERKDYCKTNPVAKVDAVRISKDEIDFYTVGQIDALLRWCLKNDRGIIPAITLSVFAGIRSSEVQALARQCPENIRKDERTIYLTPEVVKGDHTGTSRGRLLQELPEGLWKWLEVSKLDVADYLFRVRRAREASGLPTIHSGFRKTALTHYCQTHGLEQVAQWAGHTSGRTTLAHYVGIVTKADAARFLDLTPESVSP